MFNIEKLSKRPKVFKTLTGLAPEQFTKLVNKILPLWQKAERKRKNWQGRKRAIGGGRKKNLNLAQSIFTLLLYYRSYASQAFIGLIVGLDDSNVSRYVRQIEPYLAKVFKIPKKKIKLTEQEIWDLIVDATEQPSQKRKGSGYSGKKKRYTIKTQIHITTKGYFKAVSDSVPGNMHDKKLYDQSQTYLFRARDGTANKMDIKKYGDLGYVGTGCDIPKKKPQDRPLMMHELYFNKKHSQKRIPVEHSIAHLKKWRILEDRFRNGISRYNLIFRNIAGLRNFILATA